MQIDTLLHTEHQLDQLSGQFEHWRQGSGTQGMLTRQFHAIVGQ
jgi:hypothetical protein